MCFFFNGPYKGFGHNTKCSRLYYARHLDILCCGVAGSYVGAVRTGAGKRSLLCRSQIVYAKVGHIADSRSVSLPGTTL